MKFNVNQQDLQQALNYCQGVIEKRSTLPILSNILIDANNSNLIITATDLDLIFIHKINNVEVLEEGKTTTVSSTIYDIVRKLSSWFCWVLSGFSWFSLALSGSVLGLPLVLLGFWSSRFPWCPRPS